MKFAGILALALTYIALVAAHAGLLFPAPRGGVRARDYNGRFHSFIGYKDKTWSVRFPCGGYAPGPVTNMEAGKTINVRFYASTMSSSQLNSQAALNRKKQIKQARHGGGFCEFSLSYDGGRSFWVIGRYRETCPDSYFVWPVLIPKEAPACSGKNKCLFAWSWTANKVPQYYHNCVDITLKSKSKLSVSAWTKGRPQIQRVDYSGVKRGVTAPGDGNSHNSGPGPRSSDLAANRKGNGHRV
ncbi:hypothetical protein BGW38_002783 [Lunasporangiospora selenospora]|uniref:Chitin-binding protein n=1 Tax=Lunasporangiospora selenospora TaxID=979761 RepID=A0A9P6KH51_9FUNG|nr:hypothetical protein BGW38_002783 [Lunasporangiospora selenospora]